VSQALDDIDALRDAWSAVPFGLLSDLDGTLSPLAAAPADARVTPRNLDLASKLAQRIVFAVVSGRDLPDLKQMVALQGVVYVGLHGAAWSIHGHDELTPEAEPYRGHTTQAARELAGLRELDGIFVEVKTVGVALHYRNASRPLEARSALFAAIAGSPAAGRFEIHEGIRLIELRPRLGITKGTAARRLAAIFGLKGLVYLGDDRTDVDAFEAVRSMAADGSVAAHAIAVVHDESSPEVAGAAEFTVPDVAGVEWLLEGILRRLGGE